MTSINTLPPRARKGRPASADHWHRSERDESRPYKFADANKLLADFFKEAYRVLEERGIPDEVVLVTTKGEGMTKTKIQSLRELEAEMRAVARGEKRALHRRTDGGIRIGRTARDAASSDQPRRLGTARRVDEQT